MLGGMCICFCTLLTAEMASPSDAFGARLNETVIAGNCPWWVMASVSVVFSKWAKLLSGTALLGVELVAPAEMAPLLVAASELLSFRALTGGVRVVAAGVYCAEAVSAFDPAEEDPDEAKDDAAPVPVAPDDAFDWM